MPTYKNVSPKRIMVAAVRMAATPVGDPNGPPHFEMLPANRWIEVGEEVELSPEQAQALEGRVQLVE
jgi:hypothetical protein